MDRTADKLKVNDTCIIESFNDASFTGRFLSLGIEPGAEMTVERIAMFNGPRIVSIGGLRFALRQEELKIIVVR